MRAEQSAGAGPAPVSDGEPSPAVGGQATPAEWQPGGGLLIWVLLLIAPVAEAVSTRGGSAWWAITLVVVYGVGYGLVIYQFEHGVPARVRYPCLAVFVAGGLALTTVFNLTAVFVVVFTSISVAVSLPLARPAFVGLLTVTAATMIVAIPGGVFAILGLGFGTYIAGFVTFVMRELYVTIAALRRAREELATAAVAEERLRFARDLHDLLGHSLSVIVVKAELIRRTAGLDPSAAAAAAADIETVGRRALLEVRDAVSGYRRIDLRTELSRAEHALADAGILPRIDGPTDTLDPQDDEILGWAVREGATNVLRHSGAGHCWITVRTGEDGTVLTIADDGVGAPAPGTTAAPDQPTAGNGLAGLRERVLAVGGTLAAGAPVDGAEDLAVLSENDQNPDVDKGFVLTVRLPPAQRAAGRSAR